MVGQGIAYVRYKQTENYVAMAMEVAVDPASGRIAVRRVTCAFDCGLIVNPDALKNQVEGAIVQTLSRTLHEEVTFDASRVTSVDWASYPILRFPEVPAIDVILIDRPERAAPGRRRSGHGAGRRRARQRLLRRDRRQAAQGAVHPRTREGRARFQMT